MKNRVIGLFVLLAACAFADSTIFNATPSRAFGQPRLSPVTSGNPNMVEGREFDLPQAVAFDNSTNPPAVYVADMVNNRVLAWKNASALSKGDFADKAIGQVSLATTTAGGPSTPQSTGLFRPTSVAVDGSGNLYVVDSGNNRVLRFPKPFAQTSSLVTPDLVIGQTSFSSGGTANRGAPIPSAKTLALSSSSAIYSAAIAVDMNGNLWVTDPLNNRVLRFPASALTTGAGEPTADLVLGHSTFDSSTLAISNNQRLNKSILYWPTGIAFAENGGLYVTDSLARVLYFGTPTGANGQAAVRVLGIPTPTAADPSPRALNGCPAIAPQPCESALGAQNATSSTIVPPQGLGVLNNSLYVADTGNNRVVKFDTPDKWPPVCAYDGTKPCDSGTAISPTGILFVGQANGQSVKANQGAKPGQNTLSAPTGVAFLGTDMWVADSGNHRVIVLQGGQYTTASKLLGQLDYSYGAPNLIEGRELYIYDPFTRSAAAGIAVDSTTTPPHLYIADTLNNRVLGFRDARKVKPGDTADLVIGQLNMQSSFVNYATTDGTPTDATLSGPVGLLVSPAGDLYVADSGNARVLRFSKPFEQATKGGPIVATLVLGQATTSGSPILQVDDAHMRSPWGLALTQSGNLVVSDPALNRILMFTKPDGGDFVNGQRASVVVGQSDFYTYASGSTDTKFNSPKGIATDSKDRLYVADTNNNRVCVFGDISNGSLRFKQSIGQPISVVVNAGGEAWVTDVGYGRILRFPEFQTWYASGSTDVNQIATASIVSAASQDTSYPAFPIAIALDGSDNPIVADSTNRLAMYFPQASFKNLFSWVTRGLAPGMLAYLYPLQGPAIAPGVAESAAVPLPTVLADLQVTVDGTPAPIYLVQPTYLAFQVPWSAPTSGYSEFLLMRVSTGQVLAAGNLAMHKADPGFATLSADGRGQLAATNQDGTINSASNAAPRGSTISLYGTGIGPVSSGPKDGELPAGLAETPFRSSLHLSMVPGPGEVSDANITYFGLVSWFPGVFQLNVTIPMTVPPGTVQLGIVFQDYLSTEIPATTTTSSGRLVTTIAVK